MLLLSDVDARVCARVLTSVADREDDDAAVAGREDDDVAVDVVLLVLVLRRILPVYVTSSASRATRSSSRLPIMPPTTDACFSSLSARRSSFCAYART